MSAKLAPVSMGYYWVKFGDIPLRWEPAYVTGQGFVSRIGTTDYWYEENVEIGAKLILPA